jgi:hypothetical protein
LRAAFGDFQRGELNVTTEKTAVQGGCLCGAVRYAVTGEFDWCAHCHCRSCQRALGAAFATWCCVKSENFRLLSGTIKQCETSPGVLRGFCGDCGTSLTYAANQEIDGQSWQDQAWFLAATLDDPGVGRPQTHVYVSHQQPWIVLSDDIPRFERF